VVVVAVAAAVLLVAAGAPHASAPTAGVDASPSGAVEGAAVAVLDPVRGAIETARGWAGLAVVFVYSALVASVLPLPGEAVLAAPLDLGVPAGVELGLVVLVSAAGKAAGSVLALALGTGVSSGAARLLGSRRLPAFLAAVERRGTRFVRRHGYRGLALVLCVPGFPDTVPVYAFSAVDASYGRFAVAVFVGSVGRLAVTLAAVALTAAAL
jgi:uncharacterized membrane protein YdjX (TVP38/TMEM64 family)